MPLRLFITTDNHVGYNELDPVRGDDAANSFDEAISIAKSRDVDLIIQGGDLFHVNKPSKQALYSVMKTLRRNCFSDKPVEFQILNHGSFVLDGDQDAQEFDHANYEDPNYNVGIPFFAISGNHDDAGGAGTRSLISPLDVLSMAGLINHFGRVHDSTNIVVTPILIEKQGIRLALYGLASVRDERLYRTFRDNKVKFLRPKEEPDTWYNILVVHQNHAQHGPTNFLPEQFLPSFMDLVIWGHEHECLIDPTVNPNKGFKVMQPGSTVITSLSDSELKPKHVAVVTIAANKLMTCEKIALRTVRPFVMKTVTLSTDAKHIEPNDREVRAKVTTWLMDQVELLIEEAGNNYNESKSINSEADEDEENMPEMPLPLVRLRVDYSGGYEVENTTRFSNRFVGRVANSNDILHLIKRRETTQGRLLPKTSSVDEQSETTGLATNPIEQVGHLVHEQLASEQLKILLERGMGEALTQFVEKDDKIALRTGVDGLVQSKIKELLAPVNQLRPNEARSAMPTTQPVQSSAQMYAPMEVDDSGPEAISSSDEEGVVPPRASPSPQAAAAAARAPVKARTQHKNGAHHNYSARPAQPAPKPPASVRSESHPKRSSRKKAEIEKPIEPLEVIDGYGDDSEEMFSPDEFA